MPAESPCRRAGCAGQGFAERHGEPAPEAGEHLLRQVLRLVDGDEEELAGLAPRGDDGVDLGEQFRGRPGRVLVQREHKGPQEGPKALQGRRERHGDNAAGVEGADKGLHRERLADAGLAADEGDAADGEEVGKAALEILAALREEKLRQYRRH